ncbi:ABC-type nitrate/sulfonate/bicarbonate transport system, ATPase component [Gottschalkia purinilytica]|uniref:ABC-type nitrate/sulfonate/bicarbonate transport system, ATPase component n=1 Tax=Gottschalkia purinilytica TaxID=1503 RepID=A0A0L0W9Y1_GOTPU|nr:ABC transporter ATP-binding protein [Gottschalkia purinilytica]KNF08115.1 ABC-type nitrate/sulfonate/bicarbonate transport system, ATPase component [Gottschalkia purinilytica]
MYSIEAKNISFGYDKEMILSNISFKINLGDFVCLLGPSGCGKSTLLRLISGLEKPNNGEILINGDIVKEPGLDRGIVFQDYSLFPWLSTGKNIALAISQAFPHKSNNEVKKEAKKFLDMVGLTDVYDKLPGHLSGGMMQRAAIARAFGINPPILLMDEPFGALDAVTRAKLQDLTIKLWDVDGENKKTVVFVTHDVDEALLLSNKIVVLGSKPAVIRDIFTVDFKRPRLREYLYNDSDFIALRNKFINLLNEDMLSKL